MKKKSSAQQNLMSAQRNHIVHLNPLPISPRGGSTQKGRFLLCTFFVKKVAEMFGGLTDFLYLCK